MPMTRTSRTIVVDGRLPPAFLARLRQHFIVTAELTTQSSVQWLSGTPTAAALIVPSTIRLVPELFEFLPDLQLVCCFGAGFDGVPIDEMKRRNILVTHSPGANSEAVAELAIGLLLATTRRIVERDRFMRERGWLKDATEVSQAITKGLKGSKLGIVGMGAVGLATARLGAAFGSEIGYTNPSARAELAYRNFDDLVSLATWSDFLIVAARGNEANRHIVDRNVLAALGAPGILINVSRGMLVDELALLDALESRTIGGAGLDVFDHEPDIPERFFELTNVVLSPHVAGRTTNAYQTMASRVISNLDTFFAGTRPPDVIPPL